MANQPAALLDADAKAARIAELKDAPRQLVLSIGDLRYVPMLDRGWECLKWSSASSIWRHCSGRIVEIRGHVFDEDGMEARDGDGEWRRIAKWGEAFKELLARPAGSQGESTCA